MGHAYQEQARAIKIYSSLSGEHHEQIAMQIFQLIPTARHLPFGDRDAQLEI